MKQVLIETRAFNANPISLTEAKAPSGNPLVEGILATAEVKNGNGRYYAKDLWEREIDKYKQNPDFSVVYGTDLATDYLDDLIQMFKNK